MVEEKLAEQAAKINSRSKCKVKEGGKPSECSSTADLVPRSRNSSTQERSPQLNCQADILLPHCKVWAEHLQAPGCMNFQQTLLPSLAHTEYCELEGVIPVPRLAGTGGDTLKRCPIPCCKGQQAPRTPQEAPWSFSTDT